MASTLLVNNITDVSGTGANGPYMLGRTDGAAAPAGQIGEMLSINDTAVSIITASFTGIGSLTLTVGTWLVTATVYFDATAATTAFEARLNVLGAGGSTNAVTDVSEAWTAGAAHSGTLVFNPRVVVVASGTAVKTIVTSAKSFTSTATGYDYITAIRIA